MIKRRFYKLEHVDRNNEASDSSSSSSSSSSFADFEAEAEAGDQEFEGDYGISGAADGEPCSTSSGYESEDSSGNEVDVDSSGLPIDEEDSETGKEREIPIDGQSNMEEKELPSADFPACILKSKSVFKCRICPRIVCLNEETLRAHLKSKRHARSEKLLNGGRLKATLNSDGEIDNEDTPVKQDAKIAAKSQDPNKVKGGRQRQHRRRQNKLKKKKVGHESDVVKTRPTKESPAKKRRKHDK
ncbi:uncharacterized protein LOC21409737 [Morus notabilis]|uniref:uncharacterized protein LOC21409737 n=1 Tax=Morus notabilis TaxID=981085 RepID=UPI000CED6562|nr:uncharacterized protein LOC21409737 [Morus notabilis]